MATALWLLNSLRAAPPEEKEPPAATAPAPRLKSPDGEAKLEEARRKLGEERWAEAREILSACLPQAASPADRKGIEALIEDTRLGLELDESRRMVERNEERKAIARVEKALASHPGSSIAPLAEKFIRETEELIYMVLDDFEPDPVASAGAPGGKGTAAGKPESEGAGTEGATPEAGEPPAPAAPPAGYRWSARQAFNSDPRFVRHGKGSMRWELEGAPRRRKAAGGGGGASSYASPPLKRSIAERHWLIFWVYLPEDGPGSLQVLLSPSAGAGVLASLYSEKFIELGGKRGWIEVRLDLHRDFGNTRRVRLEDVRQVRINSIALQSRTIYLDFVHLE